jgi:hypothetical protein
MPENIKRRVVLTACIAIAGLSLLPAYWREPLAVFLNPVADAYAYKVERICEEIVTKNGPLQTCKTVLVKESGGAKKILKKIKKTVPKATPSIHPDTSPPGSDPVSFSLMIKR